MPARPLTRGEIAELADRLWGLINMIDAGEMGATTGMAYRLQGAVVALEAVLGHDPSLSDLFDD
jgi:hypothetical protein